jgi:Mor family transcriptional regulator
MLDSQLIEKYKLSEEGLKKVLERGEQASFFKETADTMVRPSERVISGKEIVHDLRSGMTRRELMLKYGLSGAQLKKAFEIILEQRRKVAVKIAEDVRSGMTSTELIEKYQFSNSGLQDVCQKLVSEGLLERAEIQGIKPLLDNGVSDHKERLQIPGWFPKKGKAEGAKRKVKPAEFLSDVRAGLDDAGLMHKYRISAHEVLKVMSKLIWRGLMSPAELHMRRSLAKTIYLPMFKCSSCNEITYEELEKCPHCGFFMKNLNEKKSQFGL